MGVILLIVGFIFSIAILWTIGLIVIAVGVALMILGATGRAVAGATGIELEDAHENPRQILFVVVSRWCGPGGVVAGMGEDAGAQPVPAMSMTFARSVRGRVWL